jgi:Na+-driven multidrug efflux pump
MIKATLGVIVGFVLWFAAATLGNLLVRALIPNYHAAEALMAFTLPMLLARLAVGTFSSVVAGFACSSIAGPARKATYVLALVMVVFFLPVHYRLLAKFPLWYHVVFLGTLAPLIIAGGALRGRLSAKVADAP